MLELIQANWLAFGAVLLLALAVAVWIFRRRPAERVRAATPDVLTPGARPGATQQRAGGCPARSLAPRGRHRSADSHHRHGRAGRDRRGGGRRRRSNRRRCQQTAGPTTNPTDLDQDQGRRAKLVAMLGSIGITRFQQIADWGEADIARIDPQLGPFQGRIERDDWVGQCRYLAAGDVAGFEARFGKV